MIDIAWRRPTNCHFQFPPHWQWQNKHLFIYCREMTRERRKRLGEMLVQDSRVVFNINIYFGFPTVISNLACRLSVETCLCLSTRAISNDALVAITWTLKNCVGSSLSAWLVTNCTSLPGTCPFTKAWLITNCTKCTIASYYTKAWRCSKMDPPLLKQCRNQNWDKPSPRHSFTILAPWVTKFPMLPAAPSHAKSSEQLSHPTLASNVVGGRQHFPHLHKLRYRARWMFTGVVNTEHWPATGDL